MKRVKIAVLLLLAREAQWPEALDWLAVAPLARTQSERRRRIALATGLALRLFGTDRIAAPGSAGVARVGSPKWLRILTITGGSSMAAMIFKAPPQLGQCSMSTSKTRLSSLAQL